MPRILWITQATLAQKAAQVINATRNTPAPKVKPAQVELLATPLSLFPRRAEPR